MKMLLIILLTYSCLCAFTIADDIYAFTLTTLEGKKVEVKELRGKKIVFVILAPNSTDSTLKQLARFEQQYKDRLTIVGIPAVEEGFTKEQAQQLIKLYKQDHKMSLILMEGVKVKKAAAGQQAPLLQWLTDKDQNHRFNEDVKGGGQLFFVDEAGRLYAIVNPKVPLSAPIIQKIVNRPLAP